MRALIALAVLSTGCDQLFQVDAIQIVDGPPTPDANLTDPPMLVSTGFMNFADTSLMTEVDVTMGTIQVGHLVVVAVCEIPNDPLEDVTDNIQTKYVHAPADSAVASPTLAAQLFWGLAAETGPATIAVRFSGIGASSIDVRVAEFRNIDPKAPFEDASGKSMLNTTSVTTSVVVSAAPALLVAATCVGNTSLGVDGFDTLITTNPNGDILAAAIGTTASDELATGRQQSASGMIVQLAAFPGSSAR